MNKLYAYRFLVARRTLQVGIMLLFIGSNVWGWQILKGNLSSARLMNKIPLNDPFAALQILVSGTLVASDVLVGGLIILLLYALMGGRMFCSWVCPMNIVTDLAIRLRKVLHLPARTNLLNRKIRYGILALSLLLSAIFSMAAFEYISPVGVLQRGIIYGFGLGWILVLAVFLFDLLLVDKGWCGHLCPLGAFYALAGSASLLRVKHDHEKCTNCLKCKIACPEKQVLKIINQKSGIISSGECTNCARCIEVCEDDALKFSLNNFKK